MFLRKYEMTSTEFRSSTIYYPTSSLELHEIKHIRLWVIKKKITPSHLEYPTSKSWVRPTSNPQATSVGCRPVATTRTPSPSPVIESTMVVICECEQLGSLMLNVVAIVELVGLDESFGFIFRAHLMLMICHWMYK